MTIFIATTGTPLTNWYDQVLPFVKGLAPGPFAMQAISQAAIEYCERTKVLEMDHPLLDITALVPTVALNPATDLQVVQILYASVDGKEITPTTVDELDSENPTWRTTPSDPITQYFCPDESTILLVPTPNVGYTQGLFLRVAVKPKASATSVDSRLWDQQYHKLAIANGALSYLLRAHGQSWYDEKAADDRYDLFLNQCGVTDAFRAKGRTRRPMRSNVVDRIQ